MKNKKQIGLDVDFIGGDMPLTDKEEKQLSDYFIKSKPLTEAILDSQAVTVVLENGRLGGGLARDLELRQFASRFDKWHINIRYADTDYPVNEALVAAWKADAVALLAGVVL